MGPIINLGFKAFDKISTQMNAAVRLNLEEAITGVSPNFSFDFQKLQLSHGSLQDGLDTLVSTVSGAKIKFSWSTVGLAPERLTDMATVVTYAPALERWAKLENAVHRADGQFTLQMPALFIGEEIMCYILFISTKDPSKASNTLYLATLTAI